MDWLISFLRVDTRAEALWVVFGFAAQAMFMARFVVQWLASERAKASIMPIAFWYFSLAGGVMLLSYAIHRQDPVFIMGQALGLSIYMRNLWFIHRKKPATPPSEPAQTSRKD
ncbi:lipid-A-disaccharide synthase N-terminal domain-containing protein [Rhodophyticola sp. SM2404]